MTLAGRLWVCRACLAAGRSAVPQPGESEPIEEPRVASSRAKLTPQEAAAILAKFDATMHYAGFVGRVAAYVVLVALAYRNPLCASFLTGVFVSDAALRTAIGLVQFRERPAQLIVEIALFVAVGHFWLGAGGSLLPADTEGRAIAMLGFMGVFSLRGSVFVWKLMHGD